MTDTEPNKHALDPANLTPEERIARRDKVRRGIVSHRLKLSPGVFDLGEEARSSIIDAVRGFTGFTPENDPKGDHSQGMLEHRGLSVVWTVELIHVPEDGTFIYPSERALLSIRLASEVGEP